MGLYPFQREGDTSLQNMPFAMCFRTSALGNQRSTSENRKHATDVKPLLDIIINNYLLISYTLLDAKSNVTGDL